jgi:membrane-bound lytic murein transglycosylase MltF
MMMRSRIFLFPSLLVPGVLIAAQAKAPAQPKSAVEAPIQFQSYTDDLDGMLKRRRIRALVTFSKTQYYVVAGAQRGTSYEGLKAFEDYVNKKYPPKQKNLRFHVLFVPVSRDQLMPKLTQGLGDVAVAGLTITPDRRKAVDFTNSTMSGINEIAVTGPQSPSISNVNDLSGKEVFVRKSSSYWEHLEDLNEKFKKEGKKAVVLRAAPEDLEDEDLLEMLNAGLVQIVVVDDYLPRVWGKIYTKIQPHPAIAVNSGGEFAWAIRKNSPKLMSLLNEFVKTHRQGTAFGNTLIKRYISNEKMIKNAAAPEEQKKFDQTVLLFRKYADQYGFDYLLMAAQGFQESRLDQNAKSHVGAVGVMQVMPATGKEMHTGDIHQVEPNIHAGVKYIRFMVDQYYAKEPMDNLNKVLFAFAAYNAGPARIRQLRQLAAQRGLDPNVWFGNVEAVAAEKIGMETVTYVSNIYKYYIAYKLLTERNEEMTKARQEVKQQAR